jgi:peptide/nickel transport system permease protein
MTGSGERRRRYESFVSFIRRFSRNRLPVGGAIVLAILIMLGLAGPFFYRVDPLQPVGNPFTLPNAHFPMGTDNLGRDIFALFINGDRVSLLVGFAAVALMLLIGIPVGAFAGYKGGILDDLLMRVTDFFMVIPSIVLAIALVAVTGTNLLNVIFIIGIVSWPRTARLLRGEFLTLRGREFVDAARIMGKGRLSIIFSEILPNAMTPVIVNSAFEVGNAIVAEAALAFLGLSDINDPSWGYMLTNAAQFLTIAPWMTIFPGVAMFLVILSLSVIGDGLSSASNPFRGR